MISRITYLLRSVRSDLWLSRGPTAFTDDPTNALSYDSEELATRWASRLIEGSFVVDRLVTAVTACEPDEDIPLPHHFPTKSGGRVDLLNPDPDTIRIEDMAMGLCNSSRYNGQHGQYMIGQHSCHVHDYVALQLDKAGIAAPELRLCALLHDGPEYAIGDVVRPLKRYLGPLYTPVEKRWEVATATRFLFPVEFFDDPLVKKGDMVVYTWERRDISIYPGKIWDLVPDVVLPLEKLKIWTPERAMDEFMQRFEMYR